MWEIIVDEKRNRVFAGDVRALAKAINCTCNLKLPMLWTVHVFLSLFFIAIHSIIKQIACTGMSETASPLGRATHH